MQLRVILCIFFAGINSWSVALQRKFPKDFRFGAASSSYQVEGGWNADGKGENIWDHITHKIPEFIDDNTNGDIACDSNHLYNSDIEMLKELGVDFYRFSISWGRILPSGFSSKINQAGVNYYNTLIDELLANDITPVVTLYHWDLPQYLQELGGWTNPLMVNYFEDYARVAFTMFGDRIKDWLTFNEIELICIDGYGRDTMAPAVKMAGIADYMCVHTTILSHARVYHLYDKEFKPHQNGRISLTLNAIWYEPADNSPKNTAAALKANEFQLGLYANPIFSKEGDYPQIIKDAIAKRSQEQGFSRSRLPSFTKDEVEFIRGTYDFFGLNHYTTMMARVASKNLGHEKPSFDDDLNIDIYADNHWTRAKSDWLYVVPWGFRRLLNWVKDTYDNPEIIVFESGFSDSPGTLNDTGRVDYYWGYLNALLDAIDDGCNVTAYTAWSLMDNFEWKRGLTQRFGLYHVDFTSPKRTRTPKASAKFYSEIIKHRMISDVVDNTS